MIILIAESKTMAAGTAVSADEYAAGRPVTEPQADAIMRQLAGMSVQELSSNVKISVAMARRLQQMILEFGDKTHGRRAIEAYTGVVFKALRPGTLGNADREVLARRVRIISSLYGWLRPHDIVKPYRFDFTTRLAPGKQTFAAYWRDTVTDCLLNEIEQQGSSEVLDLLPGDAARCIDLKRVSAMATVYKADFVEVKTGGELKTPDANRLKTLRGQLLRQIVSEDITDASTLATLSGEDYIADPTMHSPGRMVFVTAR